jgi:hypothetical protein
MQQLGDWWYNNLDAEQAYLKSIGPTNYRTSSPGWSDVLKLLVVVHRDGQDQALPVAADGRCVRGDETARRRGPACRH